MLSYLSVSSELQPIKRNRILPTHSPIMRSHTAQPHSSNLLSFLTVTEARVFHMQTKNLRTIVFLKRLGKTEDVECKTCSRVRITAHYVFRACKAEKDDVAEEKK